MSGTFIAVGFYTPWMLTGLLLAAIPVIIHYWFRRNYQVTEWAAVQFLLSAVKKHSRRIRLEQIILLAIRFLILASVALAMAEPYLASGKQGESGSLSVHRILVIDSTFSMGKRDFKKTHFEKAQEIAVELVEQSSSHDSLSLFRISDISPVTIISNPTLYHDSIKREINRLELTSETGSLVNVIEEIRESIRENSLDQECEVIFLTDLQKSLWNPIPDIRQQELNEALDSLGKNCSIRIINVADENYENISVTELEQQDSFLVVDRPARFQARISNSGQEPVRDLYVEFLVDGHLADSAELNLSGQQSEVVSFSHVFAVQGPHRIEVKLPDDTLPVDQSRWLAVDVQKNLRVLLVNGRDAENPENQATFYLQTVLSSRVTSGSTEGLYQVDQIPFSDWNRVQFNYYDVLFLVDVPDFQQEEANQLRQYVEGGGGLVLCLGSQVDLENYNQWKLDEDNGFLPVELVNRAKTSDEQAFYFLPEDYSHPILKPFEGNPGTGLESTVVLDYMKLNLLPEHATKVPLRYNSGDPVLTETELGQGKIFVITTSVDLSWGSWAVQPGFPPVIYELVKYAISGRWKNPDLKVGNLFQLRFPQMSVGTPVNIRVPEGSTISSVLTEVEDQAGIVFSQTTEPGIYEILSGDKRFIHQFAVNLDPSESDLAPGSSAVIRNQLSTGTDLTYSNDWQDAQTQGTFRSERASGINQGLLLFALGLFFIELLMSWKFSYGLSLLTFLGLLGLILVIYRYQPVMGWGVFVIALIVVFLLNRRWFRFLSGMSRS